MKLSIKSGFQRGGCLYAFNNGEFTEVKSASACTCTGDEDSSFTIEVADDFKGAITRFWGVSSMSYDHAVEFIGFGEHELAKKATISGFYHNSSGLCNVYQPSRIETIADEYKAQLLDYSISIDDDLVKNGVKLKNGCIAVELPFSWGDQAASYFAIYKNNVFIESIKGCGDSTPTILGGEIVDINKVYEDIEYGHMSAQYLLNSHLKEEVINHLVFGFKNKQNPLKGLRKMGYTCIYVREPDYTREYNTIVYDGANWHHIMITK